MRPHTEGLYCTFHLMKVVDFITLLDQEGGLCSACGAGPSTCWSWEEDAASSLSWKIPPTLHTVSGLQTDQCVLHRALSYINYLISPCNKLLGQIWQKLFGNSPPLKPPLTSPPSMSVIKIHTDSFWSCLFKISSFPGSRWLKTK